jgi:hypothetical protein
MPPLDPILNWGAALLEEDTVFESAPNAGAGAALESPAELFPNVNAGVEDEDCPKEKPSDAGAGALPNVVAGALALDGSPPFSGFDAKAGMEPNRLPDGAAGAGVLLAANCRCSIASSNLRKLRISL